METFTKGALALSKWDQGDVPPVYDAEKMNATFDKLEAANISHGDAFPSVYPEGSLFIRDDVPAVYKNTGTVDDPVFEVVFKISQVAFPLAIPRADGDGKIDSDFLKQGVDGDIDVKSVGGKEATDLVLRDGSQAMTGDLDLGTNEIKNLKAPTTQNSAARLADVSGLKIAAVRVATVANVAIASGLENGDTIDGVVLATGDRVLVKSQTLSKENGIYLVPASGAASRATDADTSTELESLYAVVASGTANAGTKWFQTSRGFVLGTDPVVFLQDPGTAFAAGDGIEISGNVVSAKLGNAQEIVAGAIEPKLDGTSLVKSAAGLKVNGLAVVEGGRVKRSTDQATSGATDVIFTTVLDNENSTIDISGAPKLYTARTTGFHHVEASVKTKPGADGTFRSLKLYLVETAETLKEDIREDYLGNFKARTSAVSVNVKLTAGQSVKAIFETDATDGGATIAEASLSGAYQGAGILGAGGGVDMADVLLQKSFFDEQGVLPANVIFEDLYTYRPHDFTQYHGGTPLIDMGWHRFTPGGALVAVFGWDMLALYDEVLFIMGGFRPRVFATGIFISETLPGTTDITAHSYAPLWEVSSSRIGLYKSSSFTLLGTETKIQQADTTGNGNAAMAVYYKKSTGRVVVFVRFGSETWLKAIDVTDLSTWQVRYLGIYSSANAAGSVHFNGCPMAAYAA